MIRVFALGKVNKTIKEFKDDNCGTISVLDKRLLKGFYTHDKTELEDSDREDAEQ
jgi:hypothetical protein